MHKDATLWVLLIEVQCVPCLALPALPGLRYLVGLANRPLALGSMGYVDGRSALGRPEGVSGGACDDKNGAL